MLKVDLQHWYVVRKLFFRTGGFDNEEIPLETFVEELSGNISFPVSILFTTKKSPIESNVEKIVKECAKKELGYIETQERFDSSISGYYTAIKVGEPGKKIHSISYLIFRTPSVFYKFLYTLIALPGILFYKKEIFSIISHVYHFLLSLLDI